MKDKDNSVIFLKDWLFLITPMSAENQIVFWDLFTNYEYGQDQECDNPIVSPTWNFVKKQLDNMKNTYKEKVVDRNRQNGSKGGRPSKTQKTQSEKSEPKEVEQDPKNPVGLIETQKTPKEKEKDKEKENENDILLEKESKEENIIKENSEGLFDIPPEPEPEKRKKVAAKKEKSANSNFKPPSVQSVQEYCNERKNGISGYSFVNFYQSKGWMVGSNKMKDWKAAVRTWEQKNEKNGKPDNLNTNNGAGVSAGNNNRTGFKASGKVSARTLLARRINQNSAPDSESGNITIDVEAIE